LTASSSRRETRISPARPGRLPREHGEGRRQALAAAKKRKGFSAETIIGIGVDTTGSTPIPSYGNLVPLSSRNEFRRNPNAIGMVWKDAHGQGRSEEITALARKIRPQYLAKIGGVYSSEWFFSKLLHLARTDRKIFDAAASFVEFTDYIPAILTGVTSPGSIIRGICAAGHKAMYNDTWNGLPDQEFLDELSPAFKGLRSRLYEKAVPAGVNVGGLCPEWARSSVCRRASRSRPAPSTRTWARSARECGRGACEGARHLDVRHDDRPEERETP